MNLGNVSDTYLIKLSSQLKETTAVTLILQPSQKQRRRRVAMAMKSLSSFRARVTRRWMMVKTSLQFPPPLQWNQSSPTGLVTDPANPKLIYFILPFAANSCEISCLFILQKLFPPPLLWEEALHLYQELVAGPKKTAL